MKRYFTKYLIDWKDSINRKPLIIRGARQVGKSFIVHEFGLEHFEKLLTVNFEEEPELITFFQTNNVSQIILNIEVYFAQKIDIEHSLLFLDEIQLCPEAIVSLRYFYEKMPHLHIVAAGSLLDHTLNNMQNPMPVGRIEFAYMYPMNFYEFLLAIGEDNSVNYLKDYNLNDNIPQAIHTKLLELIRVYYIVGGMPEAVKIYVQTKSIIDVQKVHESIIRSLEYDFSKYGSQLQRNIMIRLLNYIPKVIGQKFKYVNFDNSLRSDIIKETLQLMKMSRLVQIVNSSNANAVPLTYGVTEKKFKLIFIDIGLANSILKLRLIDITNEHIFNEGSLAEQFVGQELLSIPPYHLDSKVFYWSREKRNSEAELDYLIESGRDIVPIEVKAGKSGKLKSLQVFVSEKNISFGIRLYADVPSVVLSETEIRINNKKREVKYNLLSLPFYLVQELDRLRNQIK